MLDLDDLQQLAAAMSSADLQRERAALRESIRKAKRSATVRLDPAQLADLQTLEVRLHVVQVEISARSVRP